MRSIILTINTVNKFEHLQDAIVSANLVAAKLRQRDLDSALAVAKELISEIEDLILND